MLSGDFNISNYGVATPRYCETCSPAQIPVLCILSSALYMHAGARSPVRLHLVSSPLNLYSTQPSPATECTRFAQMEVCPAPGFNSSRSGALILFGSLDISFSSPRAFFHLPSDSGQALPRKLRKYSYCPWIVPDLLQHGLSPSLRHRAAP